MTRTSSSRGAALALPLMLSLAAGCPSKAPDDPVDPGPDPEAPVTPLVFPDEPFRATRPMPAPGAAYQPPAPEVFQLPNGLQVFLVERRTVPYVSWSINFPGGTLADPPGKEGLASLCLNVSFQGTNTLSRRDREQRLADLGSDVTLSASSTSVSWSGGALQSQLMETAQLWQDLFLDPAMRQPDFDGTRNVRVNGLAAGASQAPAAISSRVSSRLFYGHDHPFNRSVTAASLQQVTLQDCRDFLARTIRPMGAKLLVSGAASRAEVMTAFGRLATLSGAAPMVMPPPPPSPVAGRVFFVHSAGAPQSLVTVRAPGPTRGAPEFYAAELMAAILAGDSISSRIGANLREAKGYVYSLGGGFSYGLTSGSYFLSAPVRTDVTAEAVVEILEEIRKLREGGVTMEELERERRGRVAGLPYLFETAGSTLSQYDSLDYYKLPFDYFASYTRNFEAVTPTAAQQTAAQYLAPASLQVLVVGDGPSVLDKLRAMTAARPEVMGSQLIVLDGEGKPIP